MQKNKSFLLTILCFGFFSIFTINSAKAAGEIGVVDNGRILEAYPAAKEAQKKVLESRDQLQKTITQVLTDLEKTMQDKALSEAVKLQKRKTAQDTVETEKKKLDQLVESLRVDIEGKIEKAIQDEAKSQSLGIVVSQSAVFFGGKDITDKVINRLK